MQLRAPNAAERITVSDRPTPQFAAFLLGVATAAQARREEYQALVARLKADGVLPSDWSA